MPQIPREPRPGERPSADTIVQIIRYVRDLARQLATLSRTRAMPRSGETAALAPLTLTTEAPAGWVDPGDGLLRRFVTWGTVDGFVPSNIDTFAVTVNPEVTATAVVRVYLKAEWDGAFAPNGILPTWTALTVAQTASAPTTPALPPHGAVDPVTGLRPYYILPIGTVAWIWNAATLSGTVFVTNDDSGSFRSYLRTGTMSYGAAAGPDLPPTINAVADLIFIRGNTVA